MTHDFSKTLFRASGNHQLMTNPRTKGELLSETTKTYLIGVMINEVYGRRQDLMNKYIQKGLMVEEDAITLVSRVRKQFYTKNETSLANDFIKGTPDLFEGESILGRATKIIDIKSSFDIFTFWKSRIADVSDAYYWQIQSYLDLTGAPCGEIVHCLVDTPDSIIEGLKRRFMWDAGIKGDEDIPREVLEMIEKLAKYGDIPIEDRISVKHIERNDEDIARLHSRVAICRDYMNETFNK